MAVSPVGSQLLNIRSLVFLKTTERGMRSRQWTVKALVLAFLTSGTSILVWFWSMISITVSKTERRIVRAVQKQKGKL